MTFSIIGTGNIALFLGTRLVAAGHSCVGTYGRAIDTASLLATQLTAPYAGSITDIKDDAADVCIIAVSDAAIPTVAAQLKLTNTVLMHTAGAVALDVLATAAKDTAMLWPVYSISKSSLPTHRNIPCAWESSSTKAAELVQEVGRAFSDQIFEAGYEKRKWLHLSAVICNNFTNHLMAICEQVCRDNSLPFSVLTPIIGQTFERLKTANLKDVQTGPAIRRDTLTIERQLNLLNEHPGWQKIYEAITASIQNT